MQLFWLSSTILNMKEAKKSRELIAFKGKEFHIEWYFDSKDHSESLDYFESLDDNEQVKLLTLFKLIGNTGAIKNKTKFRSEGDKIYAFKPKPHRFLCFFFTGKKIIVTNAFHKKTDKLSPSEKNRALKYKEDYESRVEEGNYYE